jgi:hypothetical protein
LCEANADPPTACFLLARRKIHFYALEELYFPKDCSSFAGFAAYTVMVTNMINIHYGATVHVMVAL